MKQLVILFIGLVSLGFWIYALVLVYGLIDYDWRDVFWALVSGSITGTIYSVLRKVNE